MRYSLDVHHLMGVVIYHLWVNDKNLDRWIFDGSWSEFFLQELKSIHPEELGYWEEQHRPAFHGEPKLNGLQEHSQD
jgi:hypothetical protein